MLFWPRLKIDIFKTLVSLPYNYKHSFVWTVQFWMFKYVVERVKLNYFTILFMFKCGQILQQIHQYSVLANLRFNPSCITSPINVMAYWMLKLFKYTFYRYSYRINKFWMFSVIKGSETDLQANEIQLVWMKTLILQTCSSIMWFQYHVHVVNMILHNTNKYFKAQLASDQTLVDQVSNDTSRCHYLPRLDCNVAAVYCLHFWGKKLSNVLEKFILGKKQYIVLACFCDMWFVQGRFMIYHRQI